MTENWRSTQCRTDRVEKDLCEFKELTEQSHTMFGQVFSNITYNRCLSVINALMKEHNLNKCYKRKLVSSLRAIKSCLNFREDGCTSFKTKQKYQEVLRKETKSKTNNTQQE